MELTPAGAATTAPSLLASAGTLAPGQAPSSPAPQSAPPPAAQPVRLAEAVQPTREATEAAARRLEEFVSSIGRGLQFRVDDSSGRVVVRVTHAQTGELVRQIPSEEALRLAQAMEFMQAMLVSQRA
jgi:flagellar protein FlaG